jgi:hypothetical protein
MKYIINSIGWTGLIITFIIMFMSSCKTTKTDYVSKCPDWGSKSYSFNYRH